MPSGIVGADVYVHDFELFAGQKQEGRKGTPVHQFTIYLTHKSPKPIPIYHLQIPQFAVPNTTILPCILNKHIIFGYVNYISYVCSWK